MRHIEEETQRSCVRWFDYQYSPIARLLHASPNGGKRNAREAAMLKAQGCKAGFPDLILLVPNGKHHALAIEMKTQTGRQSAHQKEYQRLMEAHGYRYEIARSLDDFRAIITDYLRTTPYGKKTNTPTEQARREMHGLLFQQSDK